MLAIANRAGRALPLRKAVVLGWAFPAIPHDTDVRVFDLGRRKSMLAIANRAGCALPLRKAVALGWELFRVAARRGRAGF